VSEGEQRQSLFVKLWIVVGWIFVGSTILLTLSPVTPVEFVIANEAGRLKIYAEDEARSKSAMSNSISIGHLGVYALIMWWFAQLKARKQYLRLAVYFFLLGIGLEFIQFLIPQRNFSMLDIIANSGGVILGGVLAFIHPQICLIREERFEL
jgi:hypothetical protein